MKPIRTWIVVADGARARLFRHEGIGKGLVPALDRDFAAPHPRRSALRSDRPGRYNDRGALGQHAFQPRTDPLEHEKAAFIREVAMVLDQAALEHRFDRLVLVAPPATLGLLRAALSPTTLQMVKGELKKDLTQMSIHSLPAHLGTVMAV